MADKKVQINVVQAFTLRTTAGPVEFDPGLYHVDPDVADHWYVKAHCGSLKPEKVDAPVGQQDDPNARANAVAAAANAAASTTEIS